MYDKACHKPSTIFLQPGKLLAYRIARLVEPKLPSDLPSDKSLEVIKAILIALQRGHSSSCPDFTICLLHLEQPPIMGDANHACFYASFGFKRYQLSRMQPMTVISALKIARKALPNKLCVDCLEACDNTSEEGLDARRIGGAWE